MRGRSDSKFFNNWQLKILCLIASVCLYFLVLYSAEQKRIVTLPLSVTLPPSYTATSVIPDSVDVIIQGSEEQIYMIDVKNINVFADFSNVKAEGVASVPVKIDMSAYESLINLDDLTIISSPSNIRIYFEK